MKVLLSYLLNLFLTYQEILRNGYYQTIAEGQYVLVEIRFYISGDYLNFISPRSKNVKSRDELFELIRADEQLLQNLPTSIKKLKQKLSGITRVPKIIMGILSLISAGFLYKIQLNKIISLIDTTGIENIVKVILFFLLGYSFYLFRFKIVLVIIRLISKCVNLLKKIKEFLKPVQAKQ